MKYTKDSLIQLINRFIGDEPCLDEWCDFISIYHKDEFTKYWSDKIRQIQNNYPGEKKTILINDKGINELRIIVKDLSM